MNATISYGVSGVCDYLEHVATYQFQAIWYWYSTSCVITNSTFSTVSPLLFNQWSEIPRDTEERGCNLKNPDYLLIRLPPSRYPGEQVPSQWGNSWKDGLAREPDHHMGLPRKPEVTKGSCVPAGDDEKKQPPQQRMHRQEVRAAGLLKRLFVLFP